MHVCLGAHSHTMHACFMFHITFCTTLFRDVINGLKNFVNSDNELLVHVLCYLRGQYEAGVCQYSISTFVKLASVKHTVQGVLNEVKSKIFYINFV